MQLLFCSRFCRVLYLCFIFIVITFFSAPWAKAVWYNEGVPPQSDIILMDLSWPWQPSATYFANWNSGFYPKPNNLSFYAGFTLQVRGTQDSLPNWDETLQNHTLPGHVWSFWGSNEKGDPVRFRDVADNLYIINESGGEGLSGTVAFLGGWDFIKPNLDGPIRWYTMLGRVWQPKGESEKMGKTAYMGRWIKDVANKKWFFIGYAELPIPAESFHGNSGFIEPLNDGMLPRGLYRRFGYARKDGKWVSTNTIANINTQYVAINILPEGDHEFLAIEYAQRPERIPYKRTGKPVQPNDGSTFTARQPSEPTLDKPILESAEAKIWRDGTLGQVLLCWKTADSSSPQLGYKIEIFDNPACTGVPCAIQERMIPTARQALVRFSASDNSTSDNSATDNSTTDNSTSDNSTSDNSTSKNGQDVKSATSIEPNLGIRLTIIDVFDQQVETSIQKQETVKLQPPALETAAPANNEPSESKSFTDGLNYQLFVKDSQRPIVYHGDPVLAEGKETHAWLNLSELTEGKRIQSGVTRGLAVSVREARNQGFALKYSGRLRIPEDGLYQFHGSIDGAYELKLDGQSVLVRDGQKGTAAQSGCAALKSGLHEFDFVWLVDRLPRQNFRLSWDGPTFTERELEASDFCRPFDPTIPEIAVSVQANEPGRAAIEVKVQPQGQNQGAKQKINRTTIFLDGLELTHSDGDALNYNGPLPEGKNRLIVRAVYDFNKTVDSQPFEVSIAGAPISGSWTLQNRGQQSARFCLTTTTTTEGQPTNEQKTNGKPEVGKPEVDDAFSFFGAGIHTITVPVSGDFTATCRLDDWNGRSGEPVNPQSWIGLTAMEKLTGKNWNWGAAYYLVQRPNDLRTSPNYSDLGGTRVSYSRVPNKDKPWIRIQRQGDVWTSWVSADGRDWELGSIQYRHTAKAMNAGLFIHSPLQKARAHYFASVSHLSVQPEAALAVPAPIPAVHTDGDRFTGVVSSRSDSSVFVVRSSHRGLLRSTDNGRSFTSINGSETSIHDNPEILSVRSVAIHPTRPEIMLRGCGRGTKESSSLWKTTDGGLSWIRLVFPGDFDGVGPSALCGEVVQFDFENPDILYVGCETQGFFRSEDGGLTWKRVGWAGDRITAVAQWPFAPFNPHALKGRTKLAITTCPDCWMECLGRGLPAARTDAQTAKLFHFMADEIADNQLLPRPINERSDMGYYNAAWDKQVQSLSDLGVASSYGYNTTSGNPISLFPGTMNLEWLRPVTAMSGAGRGANKCGRFITQALAPAVPGRLSIGEVWGQDWRFGQIAGDVPDGGLISVSGELKNGENWRFVFTDGVYVSEDGGKTLKKCRVLDEPTP